MCQTAARHSLSRRMEAGTLAPVTNPLDWHGRIQFEPSGRKGEDYLLINLKPTELPRQMSPRRPIKGNSLPVLGNCAGSSAGAAPGTATGTGRCKIATRIGRSGGGGCGGGAVPVTVAYCVTNVWGTSTTLVAEIFIPFFNPHASTIRPLTLNFWSVGILKDCSCRPPA